MLVLSFGGGGGGGGVSRANATPRDVAPPNPDVAYGPPAEPTLAPDEDPPVVSDTDSPPSDFATLSIGLIQADPLVPGQSAQITFLLLNPGDMDASPDLLVQDLLPPGLAFNSVLSDGWTCGSDVGQPLSCWLPAPMAAGSQTTLQLLVDVTTYDTRAPLVSTASVSSPSLDPSLPPPTTIDTLAFDDSYLTAPLVSPET